MALRRDVSRALLAAWNDEKRFIEVIWLALLDGRIRKKKDAEKTIIMYYQDPIRLQVQLEHTANNY